MTPKERQLLQQLEKDVKKIQEYTLQGRGSLEFVNTVRNIVTGEGGIFPVKGILKHTGQFVGFLSATPVGQQSKINDPTGGATIDSEARTAINSIIDALEAFGFTSTT